MVINRRSLFFWKWLCKKKKENGVSWIEFVRFLCYFMGCFTFWAEDGNGEDRRGGSKPHVLESWYTLSSRNPTCCILLLLRLFYFFRAENLSKTIGVGTPSSTRHLWDYSKYYVGVILFFWYCKMGGWWSCYFAFLLFDFIQVFCFFEAMELHSLYHFTWIYLWWRWLGCEIWAVK